MLTCQPMALAACSAALTGIDELIDDWPAEMMTIFLPLTAGREAVDGDFRVPLYSACSFADCCWPATLAVGEPLEPLQAETNAIASRAKTVAGPLTRPAR